MKYEGYLIDLDGTMFRGEERIDGAKQFIDYLNAHRLPYLFITNNSTYSVKMLYEKLNRLGIKTRENQILTSAMATASYIKNKNQHARCFVIGETGLKEAIQGQHLSLDRKSTRLNSSHVAISYAVFCLKK